VHAVRVGVHVKKSDPAQRPFGDELFELAKDGEKPVVVIDGQDPPRLQRLLDHRPGFGQRLGHHLFTKDVRPRFEAGHHGLVVKSFRRAHVHDVGTHFRKHPLIICVRPGAVLGRKVPRPPFVDVAHGGDLHTRKPCQPRSVLRSCHAACADDRGAKLPLHHVSTPSFFLEPRLATGAVEPVLCARLRPLRPFAARSPGVRRSGLSSHQSHPKGVLDSPSNRLTFEPPEKQGFRQGSHSTEEFAGPPAHTFFKEKGKSLPRRNGRQALAWMEWTWARALGTRVARCLRVDAFPSAPGARAPRSARVFHHGDVPAVGTGSNEPCLVSSIMKGSCDVPMTNPCQVDELSEARVKSSSQSARSGAWYSCLSPLAKGASTRSAVLGFNQMAAAPLRAAVSSATFPPCGR